MNLVLFLSSLVLLHHIVSRCQCSFVLFNGILKKLNLLSDISDDILFYLNCMI